MTGRFSRIVWGAAFFAAIVAGSGLSWAADKDDKRNDKPGQEKAEGTLGDYSNVDRDSDEVITQLKGLLQEVYVAQTYALENQFRLDYGDRITIHTINYDSGGNLIPGHIFTAKSITPGRRYPTVIMVHGAFHGSLEPVWFPLIDTLVSKGYVVFFPEYRSSKGYGAPNYENDYGVTDVADVLAGADFMARQPYVDPDRLAMFGESRGGMVAVLAIEQQPKRFKVAVDVVGLMDFVAYMSYKPDYRREQVAKESRSFGGKLPDKNLAQYMKISPINNVAKIEAPLLVLGTTGDVSVPISLNGGRLIELLKAHDKVFDSKIYDNAPGDHIFMRGETPERYDATARIVAWLDKYLK